MVQAEDFVTFRSLRFLVTILEDVWYKILTDEKFDRMIYNLRIIYEYNAEK